MLNSEDLALQLTITARQVLDGFGETRENLEMLQDKVRTITGSINRRFKAMWRSVSANLDKFKMGLVELQNSINTFANKMKIAFTVIVATTGLLGRSLVQLGSDAEAMESLFLKVFENLSAETREWAKEYSTNVGVSFNQTIKQLTNIQNLLTGFGMPVDEAQRFSKSLITLGNDLSSSLGQPVDDVIHRLQSGLLGETEALKSLGIDITEVALKQEALTLGVKNFSSQSNRTLKMLVTYSAMLRQSEKLLGNKVDTYREFFNQMERARGKMMDIKTTIALGLLPSLNSVLMLINRIDFSQFITPENIRQVANFTVGLITLIGTLSILSSILGIITGLILKVVAVMKVLVAVFGGSSVAIVGSITAIMVALTYFKEEIYELDFGIKAFGGTWGDVFDFMEKVVIAFAQANTKLFFGITKTITGFIGGMHRASNELFNTLFGKVPGINKLGGYSDFVASTFEGYTDSLREMEDTLLSIQDGSIKDNIDTDSIWSDLKNRTEKEIKSNLGKLSEMITDLGAYVNGKAFEGLEAISDKYGADFEVKDVMQDTLNDLIAKYEKLDEEMRKAIEDAKGGSKGDTFKASNLSLEETINRTKALSKALGDDYETTINKIISVYEGALNDAIFDSETIDYKQVAELSKQIEILKGKIKEVNDEDPQESINDVVQATTQLGDGFTKLGDYLENDFLTALGGITRIMSELPTYIQLINANALSGVASSLSSFVSSTAFSSALGTIGLVGAGVGAVKLVQDAITSGDDERNQEALEEYQKQTDELQTQTDLLMGIQDSLNGIYTGLVTNLSKNPTLGNIQRGQDIFTTLYDTLAENIKLGNLSFVAEYKKKSFWKTRRKYETTTLSDAELYNLLGLNISGSLEQLGILELKTISNALGHVTNGTIEDMVENGNSVLMEGIMKSAISGAVAYVSTNVAGQALGGAFLLGAGNPLFVGLTAIGGIISGGFKDTVEGIGDMLGDIFGDIGKSIFGFSSWDFRRIKDNNAQELKKQIDEYIEVLENLLDYQVRVFTESTLEAFEGISVLSHNQVKEQYENFYKDLGLDPKDFADEIEELARANNVLVTATEDVRNSFLESFTQGGTTSGQAFFTAFSGYWDKLQNNIAQVYYDTTFSDVTTQADELFKSFADGLVNVKAVNGELDDFVDNFFNYGDTQSFIDEILNLKDLEDRFDDTTRLFERMLKESGLTNIELIPILHPEYISEIKTSLGEAMTGALSENSFDVFRSTLGEGIYNSVRDSLIQAFTDSATYQNLLERYFDISGAIDKVDQANSFKDAYDIIKGELDDVFLKLREEGLDFNVDTLNSGSGLSNATGYTDFGEGKIEKNYNITISDNNIYGDSKQLRTFALRVKDEIEAIEELEA